MWHKESQLGIKSRRLAYVNMNKKALDLYADITAQVQFPAAFSIGAVKDFGFCLRAVY